jgi:hypothetical protein
MNKTTEQHQKEILDKTLYELPCSYVPNHTYENIPDLVKYYVEENQSLRNALEEIAKKNRRVETCRLIALKALGELTDEDYQPELLIEENLALKMKVEDLESQIISSTLEKAFPTESQAHPITHCQDCGEYWGYHHEEHCKGKLLNKAWSKQYTNPDKHCTGMQPKEEYVLLDKYKMGNR